MAKEQDVTKEQDVEDVFLNAVKEVQEDMARTTADYEKRGLEIDKRKKTALKWFRFWAVFGILLFLISVFLRIGGYVDTPATQEHIIEIQEATKKLEAINKNCLDTTKKLEASIRALEQVHLGGNND